MSYEKHTWETGETITAEKLNHLEDGVGNQTFEVKSIDGTLNKTWKEIIDAMREGFIVFMLYQEEFDDAYTIMYDFVGQAGAGREEGTWFYIIDFSNSGSYMTDNENGYPVFMM